MGRVAAGGAEWGALPWGWGLQDMALSLSPPLLHLWHTKVQAPPQQQPCEAQ